MSWNVAKAKQHLSEVIREAAHEPQLIYKHKQPVAAVIASEVLADYRAWKEQQAKPQTLFDAFSELRRLAAGDPDPLPEPDRFAAMRPNAFAEMLKEENPSNAIR